MPSSKKPKESAPRCQWHKQGCTYRGPWPTRERCPSATPGNLHFPELPRTRSKARAALTEERIEAALEADPKGRGAALKTPGRVAIMRHAPDSKRAPLIVFEAPIKVVSEANASQREKWWTKDKRHKTQRRQVADWFRLQGCALPPALLLVTLTRIAPQPLDSDNLRPALKHVRDEVAFILGVDDASPLVEWDYGQETAKHEAVLRPCRDGKTRRIRVYDYRVRVRIEPHPALRRAKGD